LISTTDLKIIRSLLAKVFARGDTETLLFAVTATIDREIELQNKPHEPLMQFDEWVKHGIDHGWCSYPVCDTHEGIPLTEFEQTDFDIGGDPCILAIRVYEPDGIPEHG